MFLKGCVVLSLALCVLCDRRSAFSEVQVKKHHRELSHDDHHKSENHEEYANAHPSYEFSYKVDDPHTHDKKEQQETRDGDKVSGHYWLIQPDGHKRLVQYHVDGKHGFNADVNYAINKHEVHYNTMKHDDNDKGHEEHKIEHIEEEPKEEHHIKEDEEIKEEHEKIEEVEHKNHEQEHTEHVEEKAHDEENKENDEGHKENDEIEHDIPQVHDHEVKHETHDNINENHETPDKKEDHDHHDEHEPELKEHHEDHTPKSKEHHNLWNLRNWGDIHKDEHDVWSWPKLIDWDSSHDRHEHKNREDNHKIDHKMYEERDNKHGNAWTWRKSYDVWEVQHYGKEHHHDGKHHDVKENKEEHSVKLFFPASDEGDKKLESNFGLREHEHRGQPSYHMPIMNVKPMPYRRRRLNKSAA